MKELKNWTKLSQGYYRFVVSCNVSYEIIIEYWDSTTPIEKSKASLCLVGKWTSKNNLMTFEREWLAKEIPICELLEIANTDNEENNK